MPSQVECQCGCGTLIPAVNKLGKPARFAHGHNWRGQKRPGMTAWNKGKPNPAASRVHKGKKLPPEELARRQETRRAKNGGAYQVARGWKHKPETIERMRKVNRANARYGPANHFYGRRHSEETKRQLSEQLSGPNNPNWHGGVGALPYGPGFTRKYKRLIRERDNYTCQRCGITQAEYGRALQVHHLDHDKTNNDPTNLVTACGSCNVWASYHRDEPFFLS